ncbi:UNVERIFIED_CONTAM: hypothetical protein Cloal_0813 [Acetivibrio alkalicellulosi]
MNEFKYLKKFKSSYELTLSSDEKHLCRTTRRKTIIYSAGNFGQVVSFDDIKDPGDIAFSHDSKLLAVKDALGKYSVYDLERYSPRSTFKISNNGSQDGKFVFSPDNKSIISVFTSLPDDIIVNTDLETNKTIEIRRFNNCVVYFISYTPEENIYLFSVFDREKDKDYLIRWQYPFRNDIDEIICSDKINRWYYIDYCKTKKFYAVYTGEKIFLMSENLQSVIISKDIKDKTNGYNVGMNCSEDGRYIVLTFSECVKIISTSNLETIREFKMPYCHRSEFSKKMNYFLIGTWEQGYVINVSDILPDC